MAHASRLIHACFHLVLTCNLGNIKLSLNMLNSGVAGSYFHSTEPDPTKQIFAFWGKKDPNLLTCKKFPFNLSLWTKATSIDNAQLEPYLNPEMIAGK